MFMRVTFIFLLLASYCFSQKAMTKSFSTENVKQISFKLNQVYNIALDSHDKQQVLIEARVEGENNEHVVISNKRLFGSLLISCEQQPTFKDANDKLSAHKVVSIDLKITLPKHISTYLKSDIANISADGYYNMLTVELSDGNFNTSNITGKLKVNTQNGDINVSTNYASVEATSAKGIVNLEDLVSGDHQIQLKTVKGNITVIKVKE